MDSDRNIETHFYSAEHKILNQSDNISANALNLFKAAVPLDSSHVMCYTIKVAVILPL